MADVARIADILGGSTAVGAEVTLRGWVRTRRDSKAGLSFINVHDGSTFDPLQVVAQNALPNYDDEVLHLTAGCAVIATGTLADSQGKGQSVEMQASSVEVVAGWTIRTRTRWRPSATRSSICTRCRTCASARTRSARSPASARAACRCRPRNGGEEMTPVTGSL